MCLHCGISLPSGSREPVRQWRANQFTTVGALEFCLSFFHEAPQLTAGMFTLKNVTTTFAPIFIFLARLVHSTYTTRSVAIAHRLRAQRWGVGWKRHQLDVSASLRVARPLPGNVSFSGAHPTTRDSCSSAAPLVHVTQWPPLSVAGGGRVPERRRRTPSRR